MITKHYYQLPNLKSGQVWACSNGCGDCKTVEAIHTAMIETDIKTGKTLNAIYEHYHVSSCCLADLWLWDDIEENFIDFHETHTETIENEH